MKEFRLDTSHLERLDKRFYDICRATPLENPTIVSLNYPLLKEIGFCDEDLQSDEFLGFLNGHYIASGSIPHASAYAGHQFGYFVPNLGDGRALNLGLKAGYHLQLKGSGITKYSRTGDGRAVLRSSIREYLISEAMHSLGIPTTRALALISSDTKVIRKSIEKENAAILLRASESWIRFGSFEFAYLGDNKEKRVKMLADYVIEESFAHLKDSKEKYEKLFCEVVDKTAELIAKWQSVGFMHGVMNTDNMSIAGLSIDYGPYAFMERFQKDFVCNTSDFEGRYSYDAQAYIAQWNLEKLLKALSVIASEEVMQKHLDGFLKRYKQIYLELMRKKTGLLKSRDEDKELISALLDALEKDELDYTYFFHTLSKRGFEELAHQGVNISSWLNSYKKRLSYEEISDDERFDMMRRTNPKYVLKNYMLQEAIDKADKGDYTLVNALLKIAQDPYGKHTQYEHYSMPSKEDNIFVCSCSS
jgi:uncharacterized protein YdiU (UPF0061 family)